MRSSVCRLCESGAHCARLFAARWRCRRRRRRLRSIHPLGWRGCATDASGRMRRADTLFGLGCSGCAGNESTSVGPRLPRKARLRRAIAGSLMNRTVTLFSGKRSSRRADSKNSARGSIATVRFAALAIDHHRRGCPCGRIADAPGRRATLRILLASRRRLFRNAGFIERRQARALAVLVAPEPCAAAAS